MLSDSTVTTAQVRRVVLAERTRQQRSDQISQPRRVYKLKQRLGSLAAQFVDVRWILRGARVFGESGSPWCVIECSTVALPSIGMEIGDGSRHRRVQRGLISGLNRAPLGGRKIRAGVALA